MHQSLNKLVCQSCLKEFETYNSMAQNCSPCVTMRQFEGRSEEELNKKIELPMACYVKGTDTFCHGSVKSKKEDGRK